MKKETKNKEQVKTWKKKETKKEGTSENLGEKGNQKEGARKPDFFHSPALILSALPSVGEREWEEGLGGRQRVSGHRLDSIVANFEQLQKIRNSKNYNNLKRTYIVLIKNVKMW